ncbi:hypothetical protein HWQ46_21675 [Shewanella sp. D64]|uniref:hypothetical protein n=1 Tax=unclassified Shewanella TaxID=196818 RepID=UPI0022BA5BBE|nr:MULTISPECIES: hypothetical protein [unclassified Shewanella]MEC4728150.1 hypothetical protein [Shewanella sp. D64]MEC4740270.1 hypothetical protein [Shewanella sp. E94]WBJ94413.1 hypothetical protein HWQ47_21475 [Shewanella sp. MTB7]
MNFRPIDPTKIEIVPAYITECTQCRYRKVEVVAADVYDAATAFDDEGWYEVELSNGRCSTLCPTCTSALRIAVTEEKHAAIRASVAKMPVARGVTND